MSLLSNLAMALLALLHLWILVLEMFLWTRPAGRRTFKLEADFAEKTRVLAGNQGLYNGFLAAGFIWTIFAAAPFNSMLGTFFSSCVVVAGIYGALSSARKILWVQGLPGLIGLLLIQLS